jgi:hypothetical protein
MTDITVTALIALGRDVVVRGMTPAVERRLKDAHLTADERWAVLRALEWFALADEDGTHDAGLRCALDEEYTALITAGSASRDAWAAHPDVRTAQLDLRTAIPELRAAE